MFKTRYSGVIGLVGSGRLHDKWITKRSIIKIGDSKIRNVYTSDLLDSYIMAAVESEQEATLSVGWVMFGRSLLSVDVAGDKTREGVFLFLSGIFAHVLVMGIVAVIGGAVASAVDPTLGVIVGIALGAYVLATTALNFKAWLS